MAASGTPCLKFRFSGSLMSHPHRMPVILLAFLRCLADKELRNDFLSLALCPARILYLSSPPDWNNEETQQRLRLTPVRGEDVMPGRAVSLILLTALLGCI